MPVLMFCVAFGLSMDYEVFLVSRMKELHENGVANERAVVGGVQPTGRIITAAALLMSIVFLSLLTSGVAFMKLFAVGLALAVLLDAFIVRGLLVPAMIETGRGRLLGGPRRSSSPRLRCRGLGFGSSPTPTWWYREPGIDGAGSVMHRPGPPVI